MQVKEESKKADLKHNIQKTKIWSHNFITNRCGKNRNNDRLFSWAPKSLWMVTAAMNLKDVCSLENKL